MKKNIPWFLWGQGTCTRPAFLDIARENAS